MITLIAVGAIALLAGGDGPSGPVDHSNDLLTLAIVFGIFAIIGLLCWAGYRYDRSQEWNDDGGN